MQIVARLIIINSNKAETGKRHETFENFSISQIEELARQCMLSKNCVMRRMTKIMSKYIAMSE